MSGGNCIQQLQCTLEGEQQDWRDKCAKTEAAIYGEHGLSLCTSLSHLFILSSPLGHKLLKVLSVLFIAAPKSPKQKLRLWELAQPRRVVSK